MVRADFKKATTLALSGAELPAYLSEEMAVFDGSSRDTRRRFVTMAQVASLVRGGCVTFSGHLDHIALAEIERLSKRFDLIG